MRARAVRGHRLPCYPGLYGDPGNGPQRLWSLHRLCPAGVHRPLGWHLRFGLYPRLVLHALGSKPDSGRVPTSDCLRLINS